MKRARAAVLGFFSRTRVPGWVGYGVVVPLVAYPLVVGLAAAEDDTPALALLCALGVSFFCGVFCAFGRGRWWVAPLAGAWFPTLLAWRHAYWDVGLSSPAGKAQSLLRRLGAPAVEPAAAALAVSLAGAALIGYAVAAFSIKFEKEA